MAGSYGSIQGGCCYSAAKARLVALERSSRVTGFIIKTLIPRVAVFSLDIFSLNPVERIIGISGRICSNSPGQGANCFHLLGLAEVGFHISAALRPVVCRAVKD